MAAISPHDLLDQRERLARPFLGSLAVHASLAAAAALYALAGGGVRETWGDPNSLGGGSVAITPVSKIALANRGGLPNPVANDTESRAPLPPKPEPAKSARQPEDAIAIKGREATDTRTQRASQQTYRPKGADRASEFYSSTGAAASSEMYGITSGGSGVGIGQGSPFGTRFGYYAQILRDQVARNWRTDHIDPRLKTAPIVIVTFELLRTGAIRDVRLLQRSGNFELDNSCQRAIFDAQPFPPLPAGFERNSAVIEFQFQLRR